MKNIFILFFLLPLTCLFAQSTQYEPEVQRVLVRHKYYSLDFDTLHRQAGWVYYMLTYDHVNGKAKRADNFPPDPSVPIAPNFPIIRTPDTTGDTYVRLPT